MKVCLISVIDADSVTQDDIDRATWVYSAESDTPPYMQTIHGVRMPDGNVFVPEHHDYEPANSELAARMLADQAPGARVDVLLRWRSGWMPAPEEPSAAAQRLHEQAQRWTGGAE